jgi:serine/threonine protein kinase
MNVEENIRFRNRYRVIKKLGSGAFGTVFQVRDEQDRDLPM